MSESRRQNAVMLLGYALLLAVNATSIWGGIFPFLPSEFQTEQLTIAFYYAQAIALCVTFIIITFTAYRFHHFTVKVHVSVAAVPMFLGSALLITAMYAPVYTLPIVIAGGILLGVGAAGFLTLWQMSFASKSIDRGGLLLVMGTALAAVLYFLLYLVPIAVTAFLIPLILIPLCALCLSLSRRAMDTEQPMFEDEPRDHPEVYRQITRMYWKSAVCIGSLGFVSGIIRAIALGNATVGNVVNAASMLGSLVGALVLIAIWNRHDFNVSIYGSFRVLLPFLITAFLLLPLLGKDYLTLFAAITYMIFSFALMLMMVQCIQIAHNHGVNPAFVYAFFATIVYAFQAVGFVFGYYSESVRIVGLQPLSIVALGSIWLLAIVLIVCDKYPLHVLPGRKHSFASSIEFIALRPDDRFAQQDDDQGGVIPKRRTATAAPPATGAMDTTTFDEPVLKDRISKQCQTLKGRFGLTARETEIMEYIARGVTVPSIAERLVISENTVRAHSKHIYTKLDIHKRQELLDLLDGA